MLSLLSRFEFFWKRGFVTNHFAHFLRVMQPKAHSLAVLTLHVYVAVLHWLRFALWGSIMTAATTTTTTTTTKWVPGSPGARFRKDVHQSLIPTLNSAWKNSVSGSRTADVSWLNQLWVGSFWVHAAQKANINGAPTLWFTLATDNENGPRTSCPLK